MKLNKRQKEADKALDKILKQSENKLGKQYAKAMIGIRAELAIMYAKAKTTEPTLAAMTKYNNLDNRMKSISNEITKLFRETKGTTFTMMESSYLESYFREAHELEYTTQRRLGFGQVNEKVIQAAIENPISGRPLPARFVKNRRRLMENIEEGITQGLIRGEGYRVMAKNIQENIIDNDFKRALTTARTEAGRMQTMGRVKAYDEAEKYGVEFKRIWDSALDTTTRESHRNYDGKEADENGDFTLEDGEKVQGPRLSTKGSETINCRCSIRVEVKGYEDNVRRARIDGVRGGPSELVTSGNYRQWQKDKGIVG